MERGATGVRLAHAMAMPAGRTEAAAAAALALVAAAASIALAQGYFLADDFVQLANFEHWRAQGRLAEEVGARFAASIDGVNGFFRPLTFVSFAANYVLGGANAAGWLAVNLALHGANAVLVAWIVVGLAGAATRAAMLGAMAAAALFFVLSPGWEAVLWIACRYDALATFFTLAAGAAFLAGRRKMAFAACVLGLLSKEAGAVSLAFVCVLAMTALESGPRWRERWAPWLRLAAPFLALGLAYALWRWALFGSATEVYRGQHPRFLSADHWRTLFVSGEAWTRAVFPGFPGVRGLAIASAVALAGGAALAARRDRRALGALAAILATGALAAALLLPHLLAFEVNGIGGRLFYQASAFYAIAFGLAVHEGALAPRSLLAGATLVAALALVAMNARWGVEAAREYRVVERTLIDAAAAIARVAASSESDGYALVIVPDAVGRLPYGRNAQAGLMLPPVQAVPLASRVLVQADNEIEALDGKIDAGRLSQLRAVALEDVLDGLAPAKRWPRTAPARVFCWIPPRLEMRALAVADPGPGAFSAAVRRAYEASGCGEAARK